MRITKDLALTVAKKMTEKELKKVEKLKAELSKFVTEQYIKQLPASIAKALKTHPEYFTKTSSAMLNGHGFRFDYIDFTTSQPQKKGGYAELELTGPLAAEVMKHKATWETAKKKYQALLEETRIALITLGTFKKVQDHLPEAVKFLPKSESTALIPDLSQLRTKLKEVA